MSMSRRPPKKSNARRPKIASGALAVVRIGARLKHARMVRGLTLKQVADAARCSESFVSKLENDKANPSFTMLHRSPGSLARMSQRYSRLPTKGRVISHPDSRPVILTDQLRVGKGIKLERLIPYSHGYLFQGNIHHIDTGGRSDGNIVHSGEEVGYVLEGEIELTVDGRTVPSRRREIPSTSARSCPMGIATWAPRRRA